MKWGSIKVQSIIALDASFTKTDLDNAETLAYIKSNLSVCMLWYMLKEIHTIYWNVKLNSSNTYGLQLNSFPTCFITILTFFPQIIFFKKIEELKKAMKLPLALGTKDSVLIWLIKHCIWQERHNTEISRLI